MDDKFLDMKGGRVFGEKNNGGMVSASEKNEHGYVSGRERERWKGLLMGNFDLILKGKEDLF